MGAAAVSPGLGSRLRAGELARPQLAPPYTHGPGPESLETRLFLPSEIPFDQIAFSSVALSLRCATWGGACGGAALVASLMASLCGLTV